MSTALITLFAGHPVVHAKGFGDICMQSGAYHHGDVAQ